MPIKIHHIRENKAIARDGFSVLDRNGPGEHWAVVYERVKLPIFPTRIDPAGEFGDESWIEITPGKRRGHFGGIETNDSAAHSGTPHIAYQLPGIEFPQRKNRRETGLFHALFAVSPHVFEKKIAKGNGLHACLDRLPARRT